MMYGHYEQISDAESQRICNHPSLQRAIIRSGGSVFPDEQYLCIGIYWQAVEFLINGTEPLQSKTRSRNIVYGGELLDRDEDIWFDFGPMRYFTPDQVQEIAEELLQLTPNALIVRYNQATMAEYQIHPDNWWEVDQVRVTSEIKEYYSKLVNFFRKAAENEKYIITYITSS